MLLDQNDGNAGRLEAALVQSFEPVAAELRLVSPGDYIAYILHEQYANIQDIVSSSVELHFKPGTLTFGWGADFALDWDSLPVIALAMEFRHNAIWLVFKLILRAKQTSVEIKHLSLGEPAREQRKDSRRLMQALAGAKLNGESALRECRGRL
ncbi:MAG: hypothetical protein L0Y57_11060 [Beijerinckiaceae bacterium]|nr:hypothetical protein [Beijerinckiaceae bacterium]